MKEENNKDFDNWNEVKKLTENKNSPNIRLGDVYWCRIGINIGTEYNGKNINYLRPVIIIKKYNNNTALILPLTTKSHSGNWYYNINIKGKDSYIILNQSKTIDARRLENKIISLSINKIKDIVDSFTKLIYEDINI